MWMNLQSHYEIEVARDEFEVAIRKEVKTETGRLL